MENPSPIEPFEAPSPAPDVIADGPPALDRKSQVRRLGHTFGLLSVVIGALVMVTWWLGLEAWISTPTGHASMKANAALGLLLAGAGQVARSFTSYGRWVKRTAVVVSSLALVIGALTLTEWMADVSLGIDNFLTIDAHWAGAGVPGRMAPTTAINLVLLSAALLLIDSTDRWSRLAHALSLTAALISLIAIIGYVYGVGPTFGLARYSSQMAPHTALSFLVLSLGIQFSSPDHLLVALVASDGPAGVLVRRLMPAAVIAPIAVGWLRLQGQRAGYYDTELGLALYCTANVVIFASLIGWNARVVEAQDRARRHSERQLQQTRDDLELRVEMRTAVIREANVSLLSEIAERQRAQEAERAAAEMLRAIIDSVDRAVITTTLTGTIMDFNAAAERMLGWRADEVIGRMTPVVFYDPAEIARRAEELARDLGSPVYPGFACFTAKAARGIPDEREWTFVRKDGTRFPILLSVTALRNSEGHPRGFVGIAVDQTERWRSDAQLRELRHALESAVEGIARFDARGRFVSVNAAYAAMFGYSSEELVGQPWQRSIRIDRLDEMESAYARMQETGKVEVETDGLRADGSSFDLQIVLVAIRGQSGELVGHYCFGKDIGRQKQAERDLHRAVAAAETAVRARSDFLARMSHEIRTPMNGVMGMTALALQTDLSQQQHEYIETAHSSALSLLQLIDDILDFAKIDAGHLRLEKIQFRLRSCLASTAKALVHRAEAKGLSLLVDAPADVPESLLGDPQRLGQVLVNLVGNAIKFTERGHIRISVAAAGELRGAPLLRFAVTDTGIGIPPDKQALIFDDFTQADDGVTRRYGGTGLGLSICQQLARLMEGDIGVDSQPGQGSTFWFTARIPRAEASEDTTLNGLRGTRVAVVDDDPERSRSLCELVLAWRMEPEMTRHHDRPPDEAPAFALVSAELLARCGWVGLTAVADATPVILVGSAQTGVQPAPSRRGPVVRVGWPLTASALYDASAEARPVARRTGEMPGRIAAGVLSLRILLAEDHPINRKLASAVLGQAGHQVITVEDGRAAVDYAERNDLDLVLMDVQMPVMDGLTATRLIRESSRGGRGYLPIIGLTAQAMRGDRERGLSAGLDGYVVKPFSADTLLHEIETVVSRHTSRRRSVREPARRLAEGTDTSPFDRAAALDRMGGDEELLTELLGMLAADLPGRRAALDAAVAAGNGVEVARLAHGLRGALSSLSAGPAVAAAAALEAKAAQSPAETTALLAAGLQRELDRLVTALGRSP